MPNDEIHRLQEAYYLRFKQWLSPVWGMSDEDFTQGLREALATGKPFVMESPNIPDGADS